MFSVLKNSLFLNVKLLSSNKSLIKKIPNILYTNYKPMIFIRTFADNEKINKVKQKAKEKKEQIYNYAEEKYENGKEYLIEKEPKIKAFFKKYGVIALVTYTGMYFI